MSSPPVTKKKPIRELNSIANNLLLSKTLTARTNQQPLGAMASIENTPNYLNTMSENTSKSNNARLHSSTKSVDQIANLLQFYQTLSNQSSAMFDKSSPFASLENLPHPTATKRSASEPTSMTFLCRFHQRNRLIEVPSTGECNQQNGIGHEHLKQLIIQEFQLQQYPKNSLIIQLWSEQYQEYIDIESFKRLPSEGRLQVLVEKEMNGAAADSSNSKSPPTPPAPSNHNASSTATATRSITPIPIHTTPDPCRTPSISVRSLHMKEENEAVPSTNGKNDQVYDDAATTISPMRPMDNVSSPSTNLMYDLLPKPSDGIPIPRFPPHIAAFLNGNGDANQLNALVQALYQEIVKYELYPNADELRSIVSRLVERYPQCISVIGSIELLVRKLYYKFCNERKKYPVELKRRQPNKRKRLIREEEHSMLNNTAPSMLYRHQENLSNDFHNSSLDRLMHLWTSTSDYKNTSMNETNVEQGHQSSSDSSSNSSSPISQHGQEKSNDLRKSHPLNLSTSTNNNHLMCTE